LLIFAPLATYVPKAALAALLLLTAARLINFKRLAYTMRASRVDAGVLLVTAVTALAVGLDQAILVGVALSILLFVPRAAKLKVTELVVDEDNVVRGRRLTDPDNEGFLIFDLEGELFFGASTELERTLASIKLQLKLKGINKVLLRLKRVRNPDVVSLELLEHFLKEARAHDIDVWLAGVRSDLSAAFARLRFFDWFPKDRFFLHGEAEYSATLAAIKCIRTKLSGEKAKDSQGLYYLV
jgi:SulP family sulfate permease